MENLKYEFEKICEEYEGTIQPLVDELSNDYYMQTLLNLRSTYACCVRDLDRLFKKNDYITPYEMYQFFYRLSCKSYDLMFSYAEYTEGSGNLPRAFLKEAIGDLSWCINTLLELERKNAYKTNNSTTQYLSIELYDAILETQKEHLKKAGYAFDELEVGNAYATAAHKILSRLGSEAADKAYEYYTIAVELIKKSSASALHHSGTYYTYYVTLYHLLVSYKDDIDEYGAKCEFDIDQEIYKCIYQNYRQAQAYSRDRMIVQVRNLIQSEKNTEALRIAKEMIAICEERVENLQVRGVKLSLKNAYELTLKIPALPKDEQSEIMKKLNGLLSGMTHEDYYRKDGEEEYPLLPF